MSGMATNGSKRDGGTIAVVLPGGGTRGAYEAGALSVLMPALEARGERVAIYCGTSVGAINAASLAADAHLPPGEAAELLVGHWAGMRKGDVINPMIGPSLALTAVRFLGDALDIPGLGLAGLLDPSPLADSLDSWIDWASIDRNVRNRMLDALCVVATSLSRGGPVAFTHSLAKPPRSGRSDEVRYEPVSIGGEHVRASAAIPLLFPPVEVTEPEAAADWYMDGGTRLNSPIKPALNLGADKVIVIGFEPFAERPAIPDTPSAPVLSDVAVNVLEGLLLDRVSADLRRLVAVNQFFVEGAASGPSSAARAYRTSKGRNPYSKVSYALVAPAERGELGRVAERVFQKRYTGWRALRSPDYPVMSRLLGGRARSRGELLSFLMFDEVFIGELLDAGRRDAQNWLDRHPHFWCSDAKHDFDFDVLDMDTVREQQAVEEFRELRTRR
jgi:NTE family protein